MAFPKGPDEPDFRRFFHLLFPLNMHDSRQKHHEFFPVAIWLFNSSPWKDPPFLIGKPSINGPFSMATLNNKRVKFEMGFMMAFYGL